MSFNKEIGDRFFSHFCDISQKDIARRFGVQQSVISEWKTGKRRIPWQTLIKFAKEEGIDLDWLFLGRVRKKSHKPLSAERFAQAMAKSRELKIARLPETPGVVLSERDKKFITLCLDVQQAFGELVHLYLEEDEAERNDTIRRLPQTVKMILDRAGSV